MKRYGPTLPAGIGAALLCNYWVLEGLLAERTDLATSWISDLAARSEATGWRFDLLAVAAGLAVAGFAVMLLRRFARLPAAARVPELRLGLLALLLAGALGAIAGAAPLSCPEGIEPSCVLNEDPLDIVHAIATVAESVASAVAFGLVGIGLLRGAGRRLPSAAAGAGWATLALGAAWLLLTLLTGVGLLDADLDSVKGILQRADQLLFGAWLILLGRCAGSPATGLNRLSGLSG